MPCKSPSWSRRCHVAQSGKCDRHPLAIKHGQKLCPIEIFHVYFLMGPRWIAKLVHITPISLWFMVPITIVNGVYKPSSNWGAPPCIFSWDLPACNFWWNWRVHHRCSGHQNSPNISPKMKRKTWKSTVHQWVTLLFKKWLVSPVWFKSNFFSRLYGFLWKYHTPECWIIIVHLKTRVPDFPTHSNIIKYHQLMVLHIPSYHIPYPLVN